MKITKLLKETDLFVDIEEELLNKLSEILHIKVYEKHEIIFHQDDTCTGFYLLVSGKIKVFQNTYSGEEKVLSVFAKNNLIGEVPVFLNANYPATAMAIEEAETVFFPKIALLNLITKKPEISLILLNVLAKRLKNFINLFEILNKEAPARVAYYLLNFYKEDKKYKDADKSLSFNLDINKGTLASVLGMSAETFSRVFNSFKKNNLIKEEANKITILNKKLLKEIVLENSSLKDL